VTEIESIVEPDCVTDDVWWKSVSFICIHPLILSNWVFNLAVPFTLQQYPSRRKCAPNSGKLKKIDEETIDQQ
jgi:hypothetical protein